MIDKAIKGNYYWTHRGSHRRYFPGAEVIKVFAKTGGKEFPLCTERQGEMAHPTSTGSLFETYEAAVEYGELQKRLSEENKNG
jgi:hypothetical protein